MRRVKYETRPGSCRRFVPDRSPAGISSPGAGGGLIGTLEKGKEADVVAVPGDPVSDIHAAERSSS